VIETAERIRADRIDILIDLQGWTADGRPEALALRCAPVQVNWLGYAGTTGHPKLADYLLGDPVVTPLQHAHCYTGDARPSAELLSAGGQHDWPERRRRGATPGCRSEGFVFCSFNNSYKFNPRSSTSGAGCCVKWTTAACG
jgi:protein O-GlcNAc transferase